MPNSEIRAKTRLGAKISESYSIFKHTIFIKEFQDIEGVKNIVKGKVKLE